MDFASSDLVKEWTSSCDAATHPVVSSADHVQRVLTLQGDTGYSYVEYWFAGSCSPINYKVVHVVAGTWALAGSTISFHVANSSTSTIMAMTEAVQVDFNNACGGTTPYQVGGDAGDNGEHKTTYTMDCANIEMPTSADDDIYNTFSYSGGVLSLGASSAGLPGVFDVGSVPATATVNFN